MTKIYCSYYLQLLVISNLPDVRHLLKKDLLFKRKVPISTKTELAMPEAMADRPSTLIFLHSYKGV